VIFTKEQKKFIGKHVIHKVADNYGISIKYVLKCESGKKYEYEINGYGPEALNPYYQYEKANKKIIEQINEDMNAKKENKISS